MRMRFATAIALTALLALPGALFAQSTPATAKPPAISVTIVYHENNSGTFDVRDNKGASQGEPADGDELKAGWTVVTGKGDLAELKINHTSTIIKVAGNTNFTLKQLRTDTGGQDVFTLAVGKVRTVAGKASTKDQYQIRTSSAVCGVRGSDVVVDLTDGINTTLSTLEGTGFIQKVAGEALGEALDVAQGFAADTSAAEFKANEIPADLFQALQDEMKFTKLDVNETNAINKAYRASQQQGNQGPSTPEKPTTPPAPQTNSMMDNILTALRDILGFEIGSITVPDPNNPGHTLTYA
ncbi:MAG: FecR domain-containing protein, partial [Spirochaetia bacterium]